jgi:hypothetical protein
MYKTLACSMQDDAANQSQAFYNLSAITADEKTTTDVLLNVMFNILCVYCSSVM